MFKLSLKNIWSRKGRLILTALAVIASGAFLSGVFVFTDTIKASFDRLFATAYEDTDAFVRSSHVVEGDFGNDTRGRIPLALVDSVAAVPGVAEAARRENIKSPALIVIGEIVAWRHGAAPAGAAS